MKHPTYTRILPMAAALLLGTWSTAFAAPPAGPMPTGGALPPEIEAQVISSAAAGTEAGDRSGIQLRRTEYAFQYMRLMEQIGKDRAMRRMPVTGAPDAEAPKGAPAAMPPKMPKPMKTETFSLHVDDAGFSDSTGMMREGIIYTNRNLTGGHDRLTLEWFHAQGVDSGAVEYSIPLDKKGTALDLSYMASASTVVYAEKRARDIKGHAQAVSATIHTPVIKTRDFRADAGLQFFYGKQSTDMGKVPMLGTRENLLDSQYRRWLPYVAFTHYGDSSLLYHKHAMVVGNGNSITQGHQNYLKYELNSFYEKDYQHGQKIKARFDAQLTNRSHLTSLERFYLGGMNSVRGYKESMLHGDEGFAASVEYHVPVEKTKRLSAFTFLDGGRVFGRCYAGPNATDSDSTMFSTGLGLAYNTRDLIATVSLGVPLKRDVAGEHVPPTRLHFMAHWSF